VLVPDESSEEVVHCDICYDDEPRGADTVWRLPYCSHTLCYTCSQHDHRTGPAALPHVPCTHGPRPIPLRVQPRGVGV